MIALEVRYQNLDAGSWNEILDRARRGREMSGASVRKIVAVDRGHHDMAQTQSRHRPRDAFRLVGVHCQRTAVGHGAETAVAGTGVTEEHEGGGLVPPALAEIRAARFLAHGVQTELLHHRASLEESGPRGHADLEPRRMAGNRRRALGAHDRASGWAASASESSGL